MKKVLSVILVLVLCASCLSACSKTESGSDASKKDCTVALVVGNTFGDRSFYDSAKTGLDRLVADCGVKPITIECNNENHSAQIKNAAEKADIVICVGWEFYDIETIALDYPEVKFFWCDNETGAPVANICNIVYAQNEGSFLVGYLAAAMSQTGVVGAMGGEDNVTINDFLVGYQQGAEYYGTENGKDIKFVKNYSNSYDDPAVGKDCTIALNDQGADVVFAVAGACGDGVFEAAADRGFYAIGVDCDQKYINPDVIICSMKKEVGNSVYDAVKAIVNGDNSKLGTTWVADMSNAYVGVGYGDDTMTQQISADLKAKVSEIEKKIVSGEIKVNTTR